jgi:hypothetical protein
VPGVAVVEAAGEVCDPIRDLLGRGLTPEQLARIMRARGAGLAA